MHACPITEDVTGESKWKGLYHRYIYILRPALRKAGAMLHALLGKADGVTVGPTEKVNNDLALRVRSRYTLTWLRG